MAGTGRVSASGDITISVECGEPGMIWKLYPAGVSDGHGGYTMQDGFSEMSYPALDEQGREYRNQGAALAEYAEKNNISETSSAAADRNGRAVFTQLSEGLYLLVPERLLRDNIYYFSSPAVADTSVLSGRDNNTLTVYPKSVSIKAADVTDDDMEYLREWDRWYDYTVPNFGFPDVTVAYTAATEETPDSDKDEDTVPPVTEVTVRKEILTEERLPQTGQMWLPVPVLSAAGVLLVVLGVITGRSEHRD